MANAISKLTLSSLKGILKLAPKKRAKYSVDSNLLLDEYKDWNNYEKVIDSYFNNVTGEWEKSSEDFFVILLNTPERLIDRRGKQVGTEKLFTNYCAKLHEYYNSQKIKSKMTNYYCSKEAVTRMQRNEQVAFNQARSTSLSIVMVQGMILEDEEIVGHRDNLKTKNYTLTMYEMNPYEQFTNVYILLL